MEQTQSLSEQRENLQRQIKWEQVQQFLEEHEQSWDYSSHTRSVNIQSSDGRGQFTKVKYKDKEVRSHLTGAVSNSETGRERNVDKVKVTTVKGGQGHKKQAGTSSYVTTSEVDSPGLSSTSATSEQPRASAVSSPTLVLSPAGPPIPAPPVPPPPEPRDEVTECAQKLLKAVKSKKKSDQGSLNVLSEQLGGSVILIQQKTVNNHYHTHYHNHNHNNTCEEVRVETSETVNVCVRGSQHVYQRPPQDDDKGDEDVDENIDGTDPERENDDDEDNDDQTMHVDMDNENMET